VNLRSSRLAWNRIWFPLSLFALALFKLWVVHTEDIGGSATEYDALWFVTSAKHWYWGSPYSWTAFVRPPAYPLWIALTHALHIPQRLAIELLLLSAWLTLVWALRRAGVSRSFGLIAFAVASLHPASFRFFDYTMADNFYAAMLPVFLAGLISMMFRPARISTSILTGVAFAILWNTRDEGLLLVALLPVWIVLFLWLERPHAGSWSSALRQIWKPVAIFGATAVALILIVCAFNQKTFGVFAKSDMASSSFQSLIHALLRIKPDQPQRFVSIPTESFQRAFAVSPTFTRLKAQLDGETGESWRVESFRRVGVKNEIGTGWMLWAIRQAASRSGIYETPAKALRFFRKAAHEINRACDQKLVPTRLSLGGYLDPITLTGWKHLPQSFCRVTAVFVRPFEIGPAPDDLILRPDQSQIYDEMTLRQPPSSRETATFHVSSWIEAWIGQNHRFLVWALILGATASIVIVVVRRRALPAMDGIASVVILLGAAILLRVALFTALDATVFPGNGQRYLIPVMPLFSIMLLLLIDQAIRVLKPSTAKSPTGSISERD